MDSINLVGRQMCEECDAFLGKAHREGCSKHGRLLEMADATEKFTTVEHAEAEEPLLGIDPATAQLILDNLGEPDEGESEDLQALRRGLTEFVAAVESEPGNATN